MPRRSRAEAASPVGLLRHNSLVPKGDRARKGSGAADLAIVGTHDAVIRQLRMYRDAGATDLILSPLTSSDRAALQAIWDVAAEL